MAHAPPIGPIGHATMQPEEEEEETMTQRYIHRFIHSEGAGWSAFFLPSARRGRAGRASGARRPTRRARGGFHAS
eukprot:4968299-Prymnesium_polylepis.1